MVIVFVMTLQVNHVLAVKSSTTTITSIPISSSSSSSSSGGSSNNYMLFNNNDDKYCTNDNMCFNSGTCDLNTGTCQCVPGFRNDLSIGVKNCSLIDCANGGHGPDENNHCTCAPGWTGINCLQCNQDLACQSIFNTSETTGVCDRTLITFSEKVFQCNITSPLVTNLIGNVAMMKCGGMNATESRNGSCTMQIFDNYPDGKLVESLFCSFGNCDIQLAPNGAINYHCAYSKCNCSQFSPKCNNPYVSFVVKNMKGRAAVNCQGSGSTDCTITQQEFPGVIAAFCQGAECLPSYRPPPIPPKEKKTMLYVTLGVGSAILSLCTAVIIISIIVSHYQTKCLNREYYEMMNNQNNQNSASSRSHSIIMGAKIQVSHLNYEMKVMENGNKRIRRKFLTDINHVIQPGSVTAIMGPSGAGKTTLLDILANRVKTGTVTGEILVNDRRMSNDSYQRICGYVFQDDNLMSTMTVHECIMFSANLRLPDAIGQEEKKRRVDQVMNELGISHLRDRKIGDHMNRGISGGEKRRVSIGMELVTSPHILYLDEPTSGLDSASAYSVMACIVDLAKKQGRTIVFSIHQPRSNIFAQFDELILMRAGRIAYAGPADQAIQYFSNKLGFTSCPSNFNPADYLIDVLTQSHTDQLFNHSVVSVGVTTAYETNNHNTVVHKRHVQQQQQQQQQSASPQYQSLLDDDDEEEEAEQGRMYDGIPPPPPSTSIDDRTPLLISGNGTTTTTTTTSYYSSSNAIPVSNNHMNHHQKELMTYATSFYSQLFTLSSRAFKNFYRNFYLMPAHFLSALIMGILLGLIYYQLGNNIAACQNRMGSIFFMCCILAFSAMSSLELFITERSIFVRERANGYYYPSAYFISKTMFDIIPLRIFPPLIMGATAYYLIGLRHTEVNHFFWFLLILVLFNIVSGALCLCIGAIAPSVASGNVMATLCILASALFGGFLLNKGSIPSYLSWIQYLSYWNYAFEALLINELYGFKIIIDPKDMPPTPGDGNFFLKELGMNHEHFFIDVVVLGIFAVVFITLSGILMKLLVREKR